MLVGNVSASPDIMPSMSIVYKSNIAKPFITEEELPNTTNKILKNIGKLLERFNPQLVSARFDKQEMEISTDKTRTRRRISQIFATRQIKKEMRLQEEMLKSWLNKVSIETILFAKIDIDKVH